MAILPESVRENWKGVLGSIAAALVVLLQVIQLLLSTTIEHTLDQKTDQIRAKTDALGAVLQANSQLLSSNSQVLAANGATSEGNRRLLEENRQRAEEVLAHLNALEQEIHDLEAKKTP